MRDFAKLIDDHDAVDSLADRLIASARPGQATPQICHALMDELGGLLERLFGSEAGLPSRLSALPEGAPLAGQIAAFKAEVEELSETWHSYLTAWDEGRIAAERARYSGETTDLMTVVKLRVVGEEGLSLLMAAAEPPRGR